MSPSAKLDSRFSAASANAIPWLTAQQRLADAELAWLVSVRADGRPHTTPVVPAWHDGRAYFHTGEGEQKYLNLQTNEHVLVLVGDDRWDTGVDVVVEGTARRVADRAVLEAVAEVLTHRWDGRWRPRACETGFVDADGGGEPAAVFEVTPTKAFAHAKGDPFGQTRYRF
jgi:general stress protein 26